MRLDAPRDDALRQVARVRLEGLERPGLERLDVVVVHRRRFREDLFFGHRGEQLGLGDTTGPLLAQLRTVLPQVGHELAQQPLGVLPRRLLGLQRDGGLGVLDFHRGLLDAVPVLGVKCCCSATARLVPHALPGPQR